jgi:hypothetical protein
VASEPGRVRGGDDRFEMAIARVETRKEIQHLTRLGDWMAKVAEVVGEGLEAGGVLSDGGVALTQVAKLGFQVHGALHLIVAEETLNIPPNGEGRGARLEDDVEDALVHGRVQPVHDAVFGLEPLGVALVEGRRGGDVRRQAELAENTVEEASPLGIVGLLGVEEDGNMVTDVELLEHGRGRRREDGLVGAGVRGGGGGVGWGSHGSGRGGRERIDQGRSFGL